MKDFLYNLIELILTSITALIIICALLAAIVVVSPFLVIGGLYRLYQTLTTKSNL